MVAVLPDEGGGETVAIIKSTSDGLIRNHKVLVRMRPEKGEVYPHDFFDPQVGEYTRKWVITAAGYAKMNQFAGVSFISPDTIIGDEGKETGNPYFCREGSEIRYVKVRRIGIGRNPIGNLVAIDLTVTYNLELYLAQDVFDRWQGKTSDAATASWGQLFAAGNVPKEIQEAPTKKLIECPGGVVLAVDLANREVVGMIQEHITRQKFAERHAVTIVERNILKKFFASSLVGADLSVPVVSWQQVDRNLISTAKAIQGSKDGRVVVDAEPIDVSREEVDLDKVDIDQALAGDADEETRSILDEPASVSPSLRKEFDVQNARAIIRSAINEMGIENVKGVLKKHGFHSMGDIASCNDSGKLNKAVNEILLKKEEAK